MAEIKLGRNFSAFEVDVKDLIKDKFEIEQHSICKYNDVVVRINKLQDNIATLVLLSSNCNDFVYKIK